MARVKKTCVYLEQLKDHDQYRELSVLYDRWSDTLDVEALLRFLELVWQVKDSIKPILGENTYNNLRGIAFEEFCFCVLSKAVRDAAAEGMIRLFWNERILTEEFYIFENGQFKRFPKYKTVDLALGKSDGSLVHPFVIVSCKIWQSTNWLDEDRAVLDNIRLRYPEVLGYSLCMNMSVPRVSLISAQRTGLQVYDLSDPARFGEFKTDIQRVLVEVI